MSDIQGLDLAGLANLQAQIDAGKAALTAARDARYAEEFQGLLDTIVEENPLIETPTSNYAGHRVSFAAKANGRDVVVSFDVRDVKRSAERKAEKALADAKAEPETADAK